MSTISTAEPEGDPSPATIPPVYSEEELDRIGRLVSNALARAVESQQGPKFPTAKSPVEKHANGFLFKRLLSDRDLFIHVLDTTFERGNGYWDQRYITKGGFGDTYISKNSDTYNLRVGIKTGFFRWPVAAGEFAFGDVFWLWSTIKSVSRDEAIEAIRDLVEKWDAKAKGYVLRRRAKGERLLLLHNKDGIFAALFTIPGRKKPWTGTEGQLRTILEEAFGFLIDSLWLLGQLDNWEASEDTHRFRVETSSVQCDSKGHVNKRRFRLTPTGIDGRLEDAIAEAAKAVGITEEDRRDLGIRYYYSSLVETAKLFREEPDVLTYHKRAVEAFGPGTQALDYQI
jgi:hypothetical protein